MEERDFTFNMPEKERNRVKRKFTQKAKRFHCKCSFKPMPIVCRSFSSGFQLGEKYFPILKKVDLMNWEINVTDKIVKYQHFNEDFGVIILCWHLLAWFRCGSCQTNLTCVGENLWSIKQQTVFRQGLWYVVPDHRLFTKCCEGYNSNILDVQVRQIIPR